MEVKWVKDVQYFDELDSTQNYALNLARQGAQEGTLVVAGRQTRGRGRKTNSWFSPAGGLWFSLILKPGMAPLYIPTLNLGVSLAVFRGIKKEASLDVSLRWPNDIYFNEKKLGGILVEIEAKKDFLEFIVIGVGLNTNIDQSAFPSEIRERATSVKVETGRTVDNLNLLEKILIEFEKVYAIFKRDGFKPILKDIKENCSLLGRRIRMTDGEESIQSQKDEDATLPIEGQALDIDENGALLIRLDSGAVIRILSGRVEVMQEKLKVEG